jgi:hypothetical protein
MEPASKRIKVDNISQLNVRNVGTSMMESLDKTVEPAVSDKEKLKQEFVREIGFAFDFDPTVSEGEEEEEEEGGLKFLEGMVFGASKDNANCPVERMNRLVDNYKDYTFEQALRYQN